MTEAAINQGTPRTNRRLEEARKGSSLAQHCEHLDFRLPASRTAREGTFLLFKVAQSLVVCYNSPRKLLQCRRTFDLNKDLSSLTLPIESLLGMASGRLDV